MDDSYTWNEYGRPSYLTANAVGAEVARGDVDAVYHGMILQEGFECGVELSSVVCSGGEWKKAV